jgi:hypothetical protein
MSNFNSHARRKRKSRRRSGFTLVGVVTMIITVSFLLSLASTILYRSFAAHRDALEQVRNMQQLQHIAKCFHRDAHSAIDCEAGEQFVFNLTDDRTAHYEVADEGVRRTLRISDQVAGQEMWKLPVPCRATWSIEDTSRPTIKLSLMSTDEAVLPSLEWVARLSVWRTENNGSTTSPIEQNNTSNDSAEGAAK